MAADCFTYEALKTKQRLVRESFPVNLGLRVHRALSWLHRAELAEDDFDAVFIFNWIAFNAAYAENKNDIFAIGERSIFQDYFETIIKIDSQNEIYDVVWDKFSNSIRLFLDNKFVFQPFWNHHNQIPGYEDWELRFSKSKKNVQAALTSRDTAIILSTLFDRLYVLRNQLIHGGATWNSSVNRDQVRDGAKIMSFLLPIFINLMMDTPTVSWGNPYYPVVE